jgi:hypothetical protein
MSTTKPLDRDEYVEQAYFFSHLRERLGQNQSAQMILEQLDQEVLSTTRLPLAIQFLATELKHTGLLSSGFARLAHYFSAFQGFVIRGTESEDVRFPIDQALLVLESEAKYRASGITQAGLFVFQFEVISRNRLGFQDGLTCMAKDPGYDANWKAFLTDLRHQVGLIDLSDLIYLRSDLFVTECQRRDPTAEPSLAPLFGEKEGKIAKAHRERDPMHFFAALQRHLGYPEVPRPRPAAVSASSPEFLLSKIKEMEARLRLLEAESRGKGDIVADLGRPELFKDGPEIDINTD